MSHDEFEKRYGARSQDLALVESFAKSHGLHVVESSSEKRLVRLKGTVAQVNEAFGTELSRYKSGSDSYRGHDGDLTVPAALSKVITGIVGLDDRPAARRRVYPDAVGTHSDDPPAGAMTAIDIANLYRFPKGLDGKGQCIGIIELGGGYDVDDFRTYFEKLGIASPKLSRVGPNRPKQDAHINMEVAMDLEVAAAVAPKADYVFYFSEANNPAGFINIMHDAVHDRAHSPSILSVSWGMPEMGWAPAGAAMMNSVLQAAAALGITVCIASGDFGASEGLPPKKLSVSFPASVPFALSCGGTKLQLKKKEYAGEIVWNDAKAGGGTTGGGISALFPRPDYQKKAKVPVLPHHASRSGVKPGYKGRGVPDVGGDASPDTGYLIRVGGRWYVKGGTSAVAPLWAAYFALVNQKLGRRTGFVNALLYEFRNSKAFRSIIKGNNGFFKAGRGWNACTGLGTPDGEQLLVFVERRFG